MKKFVSFLFAIIIVSCILTLQTGCSNTATQKVTVSDKVIQYEIMHQYKVHNEKNSFGAVIVLDKEDYTKEDIVNLCKDLDSKYPIVNITIYQDVEAYKIIEEQHSHSEICNKGLIASYLKTKKFNNIMWLQRDGELSKDFESITELL